MNVLFIGASGYLGRELLVSLLAHKEIEKAYCLVHEKDVGIKDKRIVPIYGDVLRIEDVVLEDQVDACITTSGVTNGRTNNKNIYRINYEGTKALLSFCQKRGINRFYFTSSINVKLPQKAAYAKSKEMAEQAVIEFGIPYMIFRPALIYGYQQPLGLGVIENSIRKHGIVPVFGDGQKLEQPVFVKECADIMTYYILREPDNRIIEVLGKTAYTYCEMCELIGEVVGKKPKFIRVPVHPFDYILKLVEKMELRFPLSSEQIYHVDSDLSGDMEVVYEETGIRGEELLVNYRKERPQ